jgi:hypothetical protein
LPLEKYLSVIEIANPMHRLWSDGRWNKLTLAHGCYWGKCTFCDISLDYIKRYEPVDAKLLCDRMEEIISQTGTTGFHFVDEAAPPALMRDLAIEIIRRKLSVTWWTNIRFEKSFTADLCLLLKESGCIAVSGGLEVASDRLLALIEKGVTVEQVAKVAANLTNAGIMVHAYLMYGFPTQTKQETIDSLEVVRQLFKAGIIQSGFWHRFALTAHSPAGLNPKAFHVKITHKTNDRFANNDLEYVEENGIDHEMFNDGLKKSIFNFMHGIGLNFGLEKWFDFKIPKTKLPAEFIAKAIDQAESFDLKQGAKLLWLGNVPQVLETEKASNSKKRKIKFVDRNSEFEIILEEKYVLWLKSLLVQISVKNDKIHSYDEIAAQFKGEFDEPFEILFHAKAMELLRENGLLVL